MTWWNDYVGIPYETKGRVRSGADCWGLVRLVYREQFDRDLPSFHDEYADEHDTDRIQDAVAQRAEGWQRTDEPEAGDVVLFRIMGKLSHVGVFIGKGKFLHAREGYAATVERLDSGSWKHRVEGFYRYTPNLVVLAACPHPLRTERIDAAIPAGMTLAEVKDWLRSSGRTPDALPHDAVLMLDGRVIPAELLDKTTTLPGQRIEYRAVMRGSGAGRMIGMLAVAVAAWYLAPYVVGAMGGSAATATSAAVGVGGLSYGASVAVATIGINMVGGMLVNAIFPVRPPSMGGGITGPRPMHMLQGGSNQMNPYGAIPVILGRYRYTPPLGARSYVESNSNTSYLRMLLVWGYGPLQVSDLRIGDSPIDRYDEVEYETLNGFDDTAEDRTRFRSIFSQDVEQLALGIQLLQADGFSYHTLSQETDKIRVEFHFPQGLFGISNGGSTVEVNCPLYIGVRQVGTNSWQELSQWIPGQAINLNTAYYNTDSDAALEPVYQWTRISLNKRNQIVVRKGAFTTNPAADPSGSLLSRLQNDNFGVNATFGRLPAYGAEEEGLWDVCVYGNTIHATVDQRGTYGAGGVTGCDLTMSGLSATLAEGSILRVQQEYLPLRKAHKKGFSTAVTFYVPKGVYEVRVRRANDSSNSSHAVYDACYLQTITGYALSRPIIEPNGVKLAMTAIRIKATNQLNGNLEGVTGTVQAICKDWDSATNAWIVRPTRNPASLLRHVLQHPGNAQRVTDAQLDLLALQDFHEYCRVNGFMFDMVMTGQQSVLDTLRDIAAAGRASPTLRDGKWTIIIDRPRTTIAQHFTPHNSWGFEGVRTLPKMPHAFRVQFSNAAKGFQPDERIVYNDGYSAANATLFEGLQLPGVTSSDAVFKHARFHLAQIKLRPETYTLNADIEHLVCTRGDLVRVTHDVPMWGLGTGRIKNRISATVLELDEQVPMDAGVQYTVRIRLEDGSSITRTVAPAATDGYYDQITLTSSVTTTQGKAGNLFMFGSLNSESVELIVQSIEPAENMTARITLVDYSPAVYDSDSETIPAFDSQITLPPSLLQSVVTHSPTITRIASDESVMTRLSPGRYRYAIQVSFANPKTLPSRVTHVEGQIDFAGDNTDDWQASNPAPIKAGAIIFDDVQEGSAYRLRLRYIDDQGRAGPWTATQTHTVTGKSTKPSSVTGLTYFFTDTTLTAATITLDWIDSPEVDVEKYEVSNGTRTITVLASTFTEQASWTGNRTYTVRAIDAAGNKSDPTTIVVPKYAPNAPLNFRSNVIDNNVLLYWDAPTKTSLPIVSYELRKGDSWETAEVIGRKSGGFTLVFESEGGNYTYWLASIDSDDAYSTPVSHSAVVSEPPDYVLHANYTSAFDGTKNNMAQDATGYLLPINVTETFAQHFSARGWPNPQAQIDAGYPVFIQPAADSGYYEEVIDYGQILAGSRITVTKTSSIVVGTPMIACRISISQDGVTWTNYGSAWAVYATAFRYVKVRITVASTDNKAIYRLSGVRVRLDAKLVNDAGSAVVSAADAGGTAISFNVPFLDVTSITVTPQGTTPLNVVYDFNDVPNPTGFSVYLFDSTGNRASGTVSWSVKGY